MVVAIEKLAEQASREGFWSGITGGMMLGALGLFMVKTIKDSNEEMKTRRSTITIRGGNQ